MITTHDHEAHLRIREPIVDGIFYPDDPAELRKTVRSLLAAAGSTPGHPAAVVSPHGGYTHSGAIAAEAFRAASGRRDVKSVVILAPVHRDPDDHFYLTESVSFRTPLGDVRVDRSLSDQIQDSSPLFVRNDIPHLEEHAIEVQLPFIQEVFPDALVVPVLAGKTTIRNVRTLSDALAGVYAGRSAEILIVVSANLSSFLPSVISRESASLLLEMLARGDWERIVKGSESGAVSSIGAGCMASVAALFAGEADIRILSTATSAKEVEEPENEVRYGAVVFEAKGAG